MNFRRSFLACVVALSGLLCASAFALDTPTGRPILTVSGAISKPNAGAVAKLDMKMIEALPQQTFTTRTPWYDKPVTFTGPLLADVVAAVGGKGSALSATAINDYTITIPMDDVNARKVIMARLIDGKPIPVREKGPLFVVYPFDSDAALRTSVFYERSIWQLKAMEVKP
ncbi:MAG: hypothetical protein MUF76_14575 [Hydrogenophaga sp.]|jgi:hypothetical protein|nr:hypothetical protein [Hydrogenophaga sp.]